MPIDLDILFFVTNPIFLKFVTVTPFYWVELIQENFAQTSNLCVKRFGFGNDPTNVFLVLVC